MLQYKKASNSDLKSIVTLIHHFNSDLTTRVSWLGESEAMIRDELLRLDPSFENSFLKATDDGEIVAVLGLYISKEQKVARLLGPYVKSKNLHDIADELFTQVVTDLLPGYIETLKIAFDERNQNCLAFALRNGFRQYNTEEQMILNRDSYSVLAKEILGVSIRKFRKSDEPQFQKLHSQGVYLTANEVLKKQDEKNMIFVAVDNSDKLLGYVFAEIEDKEVHIHFIKVREKYRGRGIGFELLRNAIDWGFGKSNVKKASLSVRPENEAKKLYEGIGFERESLVLAFSRNL